MASEEEVAAALIAALRDLGAVPYDLDEVPATRPDWYTEVVISRRFGGEQRASGERDGRLWRATVRQVARTVSNARNLRDKCSAIENVSLTVGSTTTTPVEFETSDSIGEDGEAGWFSGLETWTFALF